MVDKDPWLTSKQIQADLQTQGTTVSARTIRLHLNEKGRYGRRTRRTPLLTQRHKKARLEFAKTYETKPQSFWENILWTDETKVELFGKGRHGTVYRKRNEAFKEKKHSPFSQTCWRFKESHWTPLERSQNSGWENTSLKSEWPGAVCKRTVVQNSYSAFTKQKVLVLCEFTHSRLCSIHKHTPDLSEQKWSKSPLNIFTFSHD